MVSIRLMPLSEEQSALVSNKATPPNRVTVTSHLFHNYIRLHIIGNTSKEGQSVNQDFSQSLRFTKTKKNSRTTVNILWHK